MKIPHRLLNVVGTLFCLVFLCFAFWLEYEKNLPPCSLCILQRWVVLLLLGVFFMASIHGTNPLRVRIYGFLTLFVSLVGSFISARYLWLSSYVTNDNVSGSCTANFSYLLKTLPPLELIKTLFWGGSGCIATPEYFLGISIPWWTFSGFLILLGISIVLLVKKNA
jgi:protein dithiol:quinone oxidoreductase